MNQVGIINVFFILFLKQAIIGLFMSILNKMFNFVI